MTSVFVTATGQVDNLGDSLLRRGYLDVLRSAGKLHVNLQGSNADYISGLGLRDEDRVYMSRRAWEASLLMHALSGRRPVLALNAGEARLTADHAYIGRRVRGIARIVQAAGGAFVQAGLGVREAPVTNPPAALVGALTRGTVVTWRDEVSAESVGVGIVQPDWAFALDPMAEQVVDRDWLVVTMRGDRDAPSDEWLGAVRRLALDNNLAIRLVSQVRRDNSRLREIADRIGSEASVHEWGDDQDHAGRLGMMAAIYSRSRAVVSDRLHALILGSIHGAVPIGLTTGSAEKLRRTLAPARLDTWVYDPSESSALGAIALPDPADIFRRAAQARRLSREVGVLISSGAGLARANIG